MAAVVDASSPARASGTGGSAVTASFTAPADSLLVACVEFDSGTANGSAQTVADSGGLAWTTQVMRSGSETTTGGTAQISTARTTTAVSRTVTVTQVGTSSSNRLSMRVYVVTGADVDGTPVDSVTASNESGSATNNYTTPSLTPGANGIEFCAAVEWNALGAATSADLKGPDGVNGSSHAEYAGAMDVIDGWKTCSSGVGVTGNLDAAAGTPQWKECRITVREAGGGGGTSILRQMMAHH